MFDLSTLDELRPHKNIGLQNVTHTDFTVPQKCKRLTFLSGTITSYKIPEGIVHFYCSCMNTIEHLELPQSLEELYCSGNPITKLVIPPNIRTIVCDNCKITSIEPQGELTCLERLSAEHNKIASIDFKLPKTLHTLDIFDNEGIKIKYLDFAFKDASLDMLCGGDFFETLNPGSSFTHI